MKSLTMQLLVRTEMIKKNNNNMLICLLYRSCCSYAVKNILILYPLVFARLLACRYHAARHGRLTSIF